MKRCPECLRDYYDDSLRFCLDDGIALVDGQGTKALKRTAPDASESGEPATEILTDLPATGAQTRRENDRADLNLTDPTANYPGNAKAATAGSRNRFVVVGVGILVLVAGILGYRYVSDLRSKPIESIAVMPFVNDSGNGDLEYLSDGMTEALINSLSRIPNLHVKARSSVFRYKGNETSAGLIGRELNVQAILNGRVVQHGDELTLYIELVDTSTENSLWKQTYYKAFANLVVLQHDVSRDVADNLKIKLSGVDEKLLAKNSTQDAEAYQLYLKGRYFWMKFPAKDFEKCLNYYQRAVEKDPSYALAYAGLAEYYGFSAATGLLPPSENWPRSEAAARKALELDDALPDAHNAMAGVLQFSNDRAGAEQQLRSAIELNPNYAEGRNHYAAFLMESDRFEESFVQIGKVLELEPLSVRYNYVLALLFYRTRDFDRAADQIRKTLELDPDNPSLHEFLGVAFEQKEMFKEAILEWSRALRLSEDDQTATRLEGTFGSNGFRPAVQALWRTRLEKLKEKSRRGEYVPAMKYVLAYVRLDNKELAIDELVKAEGERNSLINDFRLDPVYDGLRSELRHDPRFESIVKKLNLPG
ncbi:MAG: tetratricopeptide repeat protein [Pyrinomonadaceae bacterium]